MLIRISNRIILRGLATISKFDDNHRKSWFHGQLQPLCWATPLKPFFSSSHTACIPGRQTLSLTAAATLGLPRTMHFRREAIPDMHVADRAPYKRTAHGFSCIDRHWSGSAASVLLGITFHPGSPSRLSQKGASSALEGHLLQLQLHCLASTRLPVVGASSNALGRRHLPSPVFLQLGSVLSTAPAEPATPLTAQALQSDQRHAGLAYHQIAEAGSLCTGDSRLHHALQQQ